MLIELLLAIFVAVLAAVLLFMMVQLGLLIFSMARGAPYVATDPELVLQMIQLARVELGDRAVDLGSGDGRIVIALVRAGAMADGFETNPFLVWQSRRKIKKAGLQDRATINWKSFWGANLSKYSVVTVYGISYIMPKLEEKLRRELTSGARVVSKGFRFPTWSLAKQKDNVYLYEH